jgi:small subunit ribosomal protein S4
MGSKKRLRKLYERPMRLWDKNRVELESKLRDEYGLKNSRELWRMQTIIRKIRREARRLLSSKGADPEARRDRLLARVKKYFLKKADATLDDILSLTTRDILERRLQTVVVRKRMARTARMARQYITHGHIVIGDQVQSSPSYLVSFEGEQAVGWAGKPLYAAPSEKPPKAEEKGEAAAAPEKQKD